MRSLICSLLKGHNTQCQGTRLVASGSLWSTRMPVFALMIGSCTSASILLNSPRASHVQHRLFLSSCHRSFRKETECEADLEDVDKMRNLDVRQPSMETEKDAEANKGGKMEALALFESAEATLREVLVIRAQLLEDDDPALLTTRSNLASILQRTGRGVEAEEMMRTTISRVQEKARGKASPEVATAMNNLGYLLKEEGRLGESRALYKEALRIRRALYPKEHPLVIVSLNNLAELCLVTPGLEGEGRALQDEILKLLNPVRRDGDGSKSVGMIHEEKPN
ncbi:tetratricopeptide repeat family protein [Nannochloropsis gaditana]|uniref:Tetratricopeptide repeat family protein n=1 Tax=Nannochloropsis gaditana TaxID=72520 RepID=W7U4R1_9STRA|nr:tetratricopeptide repeat family protein [Nannochloropsis gaditana]